MANMTGFPSPAQGYEAKAIDLNREIIRNAPATFLMRYSSSDLLYLGIFPDSTLVIDRSIIPVDDSLVVFSHEGKFKCRKWVQKGSSVVLVNGQGNEIELSEDVQVFGVVKTIIRNLA
jgi:DNA polymerase V